MIVNATKFDWFHFTKHLKEKNIEAAKQLITPENIHSKTAILALERVCSDGPDDPLLVKHFFDMGLIVPQSRFRGPKFLDLAVTNDFHRSLHVLLDHLPINEKDNNFDEEDGNFDTPLEIVFSKNNCAYCLRVLMDAGAKPTRYMMKEQPWIKQFVYSRTLARECALALLCVPRMRGKVNVTRDVMRIVARCVWSTRCGDVWDMVRKYEKRNVAGVILTLFYLFGAFLLSFMWFDPPFVTTC